VIKCGPFLNKARTENS